MKTKKHAIIAIIVTAAVVLFMTVYTAYQNKSKQFAVQDIPSVQLSYLDGSPYSFTDEADKLLVFISSGCPFCAQKAEDIINSISKLQGTEIIFISAEHPDSILHFSLNHYSGSITYLCDETALFSKELKVKKYPTTFIYSGTSQRLTRRFVGAVPLEQILRELSNG